MPKRRTKSLIRKNRIKRRKALGAAAYAIAEYFTGEKQGGLLYKEVNQSILEKIKSAKKSLEKDDNGNPGECHSDRLEWFQDRNADYTLKPDLNNSGTRLWQDKPNETPTSLPYPGSKEGIKNQIVPVIGQLRGYAKTKRHIEGFLGGGGAFVAFPKHFTDNSVAIEYKKNVAEAHKGFVKSGNDISPIQQCVMNGYFESFPSFENQKTYDAAISYDEKTGQGGRATTNPCDALISTKIVKVNSYNKKDEDNFRASFKNGKTLLPFRINNQTELYSRPNVKILNGSFFDYLGDGVSIGGSKKSRVLPQHGDLIYMDPPYLGTEGVYKKGTKDNVKYAVPENQETCDKVPGDELDANGNPTSFQHRRLWKETAKLYEQMRKEADKPGKGVHIAISHSAEGRFHCLIKNSFKKAIERGEFKACRVDVERSGGQSRGFFQLAHGDTPREQEWLMIVSPHAKNIECDEANLDTWTPEEDQRILKSMGTVEQNRTKCRNALGEKVLKEYVDTYLNENSPDKAAKFLVGANVNRCVPDDSKKYPEWIKDQKYSEVLAKLKEIKQYKQCKVYSKADTDDIDDSQED